MSQPYSPHQMQSGLVPSGERMSDPTTAPPVSECNAAVMASIDADDFSVQHAPNMASPGTNSGPAGGVRGGANGTNSDS